MFNIKKKLVVGLLFVGKRAGSEERLFAEVARKKGVVLVPINLYGKFDEEEFERKVRGCDIIYNNSAEEFVIEPLKTVEELGKKVIDTSRFYYYTEDKWMFYIKCREKKVPVPETILLSDNLVMAGAELKEFGRWPVVLKKVYGCCGDYVEKADCLDGALKIIKSFWRCGCAREPVIAQEFINSYSYRVTIINNKIVQTAVKSSRNWKRTGVYQKKCASFRVGYGLRKILGRVIKIVNMGVFGVDLLKKDGRWLVLEVNAEPALDFIDGEKKMLVGKILDYLKWCCRARRVKQKRKA